MSNLLGNLPLPTTLTEHSYLVRLATVPGLFAETEVPVHDYVIIDGRRIVRSAYGHGFWHIPDDPELIASGTLPLAVFEPHTTASFVCPVR